MKSTYSLIKKVLKSNKGGKALFLINHVCFTYAIFPKELGIILWFVLQRFIVEVFLCDFKSIPKAWFDNTNLFYNNIYYKQRRKMEEMVIF